jgi:hypothetical protein
MGEVIFIAGLVVVLLVWLVLVAAAAYIAVLVIGTFVEFAAKAIWRVVKRG